MASVHYVNVRLVKLDQSGNLITGQTPLKSSLKFSTEHRIEPDVDIPNSVNNPSIKEYLEAEAADGFEPKIITQSFIVTWHT